MTISINQQVDYIWKKIGYGVAKTDTSAFKTALNENIPSPLLLPGDEIWVESDQIPFVKPTASTPQVELITVECIPDVTVTANRTWLTNLTDWIPIQFGPTYLPKVYIDVIGSTTPEVTGQQLFPNGTDNNDEWFFDFQAGVLNFIGDNFPYGVDFTGKSIFVAGARYVGLKGLSQLTSGSFGNIILSGQTITATGGNIIILSPGGSTDFANTLISNVATPINNSDVATKEYVDNLLGSMSANAISQGDSSVSVTDTGTGIITVTVDAVSVAEFSSSGLEVNTVTITGELYNAANLVLSTNTGGIVTIDTDGALALAVGSSIDRPLSPPIGAIRYNTDFNQIEYFNGTNWALTQSIVQTQSLIGDNVTDTFTLDYDTTAAGILVNINGVLQQPGIGYTVSGDQLTLSEPPLTTDRVEIRFISALSNFDPTVTQIASSSIPINTSWTLVDEFNGNFYRSAKYVISVISPTNETQLSEVLLTHNGVSASVTVSSTVLSLNLLANFSTTISGAAVRLLASGVLPGNSVRIQKTYFTL